MRKIRLSRRILRLVAIHVRRTFNSAFVHRQSSAEPAKPTLAAIMQSMCHLHSSHHVRVQSRRLRSLNSNTSNPGYDQPGQFNKPKRNPNHWWRGGHAAQSRSSLR